MQDYLKPLQAKLKSLLPVNTYFDLDDSSQSHVIFPTNHIHLVNDFISIEVATCIYGNISEHQTIINNISELYLLLTDFADTIEDYTSINIVGSACARLSWGGVYIDDDSKDFNSINELIMFLKINK